MPPGRPADRTLPVAREVADGLTWDGAEAVVLVGSHASGDVGPREFSFRLERRGGLLVSVTSRPLEAYRRELTYPGSVCAAVPGWRGAVVLRDPDGMAASLIEEARDWTWGRWRSVATGGGGDLLSGGRGTQAGRRALRRTLRG